MIGEDGYYSYREILGYGAKWNFVLGDRGRGKSYGAKKMLLAQSGTFMCLYRNIADLELAVHDWLGPMYKEGYKPEQFEWESAGKTGGVNLLMNGVVKGYFRCITQVNHIKQEWFPDDLNWIFFDEFIPMVYRKLGGVGMSEGECLRVIYKTIDHDTAHSREERGLRPLRVILVANPFTWDNPILSYFHVLPTKPGISKVGPDIVCEMLEPYEKTQGGKKTVDDFLGDGVNRTQGWMDEGSFIGKMPKGSKPFKSLRVDDRYYGFYKSGQSSLLYCKEIKGHMNTMRYGSTKGLKEDEISIDKRRQGHTPKKDIFDMIISGQIRFDNVNTKFNLLRDTQ